MTKRVVIFAGFNRKSYIEDYVLYYLKGLREIADTLIYTADNAPSLGCLEQLDGIADKIIFEKHGEYDFGSWKRGLRLARRLSLLTGADELVLCNDSCYGPVFPFGQMFARMENSRCDFWGITKNCHNVLEHIQSYFIVFKENVFTSPLFKDFFESVTREKSFWDVVRRYEVGLSRLLVEKGKFCFDVYCPIDAGRYNPSSMGISLLAVGCPLLKRKIFICSGFSRQSGLRLIHKIPNTKVKEFMKKDFADFFPLRCLNFISRFLYQNKVTKSGHHIIKICKIPIVVIDKSYKY